MGLKNNIINMIKIVKNEIYQRLEDGSSILVGIEEMEMEVSDVQLQIAEKEQQLLKIYEELQELKANQ